MGKENYARICRKFEFRTQGMGMIVLTGTQKQTGRSSIHSLVYVLMLINSFNLSLTPYLSHIVIFKTGHILFLIIKALIRPRARLA